MSGAGAVMCGCGCVPVWRIYRPCCGVDGTEYWGTNASVSHRLVGEVCYGWQRTTSDPADIVGMSELPAGDDCACPEPCDPEPFFEIYGPCCDEIAGPEYWTTEGPGGVIPIAGVCYAGRRSTTDPDDIFGLSELPVTTPCSCVSLSAVFNSETCGYVCIDCVDVYVGVEIYGNGEYEIGYWKFSGDEWPWYFDGDDCDRELADVPPWEGQFGWKCAGDEMITVETIDAIVYAIRGCSIDLPAYEEITSHSPDSFTYGGDPECP